jgi:hypothetical protein
VGWGGGGTKMNSCRQAKIRGLRKVEEMWEERLPKLRLGLLQTRSKAGSSLVLTIRRM